MMTVLVTWIDGTRTWTRCDWKSINGYELDWAVESVIVLFEK